MPTGMPRRSAASIWNGCRASNARSVTPMCRAPAAASSPSAPAPTIATRVSGPAPARRSACHETVAGSTIEASRTSSPSGSVISRAAGARNCSLIPPSVVMPSARWGWVGQRLYRPRWHSLALHAAVHRLDHDRRSVGTDTGQLVAEDLRRCRTAGTGSPMHTRWWRASERVRPSPAAPRGGRRRRHRPLHALLSSGPRYEVRPRDPRNTRLRQVFRGTGPRKT